MSRMCIEVSFLAGTDIAEAILEAKQKAERWDVTYVKFNFNGIDFSIGRNAVVSSVIEEYDNNPNPILGIVAA